VTPTRAWVHTDRQGCHGSAPRRAHLELDDQKRAPSRSAGFRRITVTSVLFNSLSPRWQFIPETQAPEQI
jgi:hypothetical protein